MWSTWILFGNSLLGLNAPLFTSVIFEEFTFLYCCYLKLLLLQTGPWNREFLRQGYLYIVRYVQLWCICMIYKKVKMAQCLFALKMWSFTKKPNVFIFKEFFYILAYICVYNFVLVCVKICASWKIDCSVQRKRCFSLPTRRCFHTILLSPSFVSTQLEKMTFQILIYLYKPISKI